jgi:hypothetical protein
MVNGNRTLICYDLLGLFKIEENFILINLK